MGWRRLVTRLTFRSIRLNFTARAPVLALPPGIWIMPASSTQLICAHVVRESCCASLPARVPLPLPRRLAVWMKNGDRLTGKITLFDGGKLLLKTDAAAAITLKWDKILPAFESPSEPAGQAGCRDWRAPQGHQAARPGQVTLVNGEPKTVELASIQQMMPPKPILRTGYGTATSISRWIADFDRERVSDYDIDFKTNARHGLWRHNVQGRVQPREEERPGQHRPIIPASTRWTLPSTTTGSGRARSPENADMIED